MFCDVIDVIIPKSGSKKGRQLKILAEINLEKPFMRGAKIKFQGQEVWVDFKYEYMALFCFYCGKVGHSKRACSKRVEDAKKGKLSGGQYGDWLKAENIKLGPKKSGLKETEGIDRLGDGER